MTQALSGSPLTDIQKAMFEGLGLDNFENLALLSVQEKSTGRQRAVVVRMDHDGDSVLMNPVAMLLDDDDDLDLFDPPHEEGQ
jgi:hypothetical protein